MARAFVDRNGLGGAIDDLQGRREFLASTWLFGEAMSFPVESTIAQAMRQQRVGRGRAADLEPYPGVVLVRRGHLELLVDDDLVETVGVGDFWGESMVLHETPGLFRARVAGPAELCRVPRAAVVGMPVVRWELREAYERRMRALLTAESLTTPAFRWRETCRTGIEELDEHHRELFVVTGRMCEDPTADPCREAVLDTLGFLIDFGGRHFPREEALMQEREFPGLEAHRRKHESLVTEVLEFRRRAEDEQAGVETDFVEFLRDWIIDHLLTEDQKYARFFRVSPPNSRSAPESWA